MKYRQPQHRSINQPGGFVLHLNFLCSMNTAYGGLCHE
jgi:hypothetical protein